MHAVLRNERSKEVLLVRAATKADRHVTVWSRDVYGRVVLFKQSMMYL